MNKKLQFVTAYGDRIREPYYCEGESLTQQHMKAECDIKTIIKKHDRTGIINHINRGVAQYGDYSEINEYREALDVVAAADQAFMELPAELRKMFDNDAGEFFEFATNPQNHDQMVELGLASSPAPVEPPRAERLETAPAQPVDTDKSEG